MSEMTFDSMYAALGGSLTNQQRTALDEQGFVVLPGHFDDRWRRDLADTFDRLVAADGDDAARVPGTSYQPEPGAPRVAYCVNRGAVFEPAFTDPTVLAAAAHVLGRPFMFHSFNARDVLPGQGWQALHADYDRLTADEPAHVVNTLWLLDDFTTTNGATRIVPGSHRIPGRVADHVADPDADHPDQVLVTAPAGTLVIFNAHCWHGGTRNVAGSRRRVLHVSYVGRDGHQQVVCTRVTAPDVLARLRPEVRYLLAA